VFFNYYVYRNATACIIPRPTRQSNNTFIFFIKVIVNALLRFTKYPVAYIDSIGYR